MMIACPRCEASYAVDVAVFGARARVVQCSACHYRWSQSPIYDRQAESAENPATFSQRIDADDSPAMPESVPEEAAGPTASSPCRWPDSIESGIAAAEAANPGSGDLRTSEPGPPAYAPEKTAAECEPPASDSSQGELAAPHRRRRRALVAACAAMATVLSLTALLILLRGPVLSAIPNAAGVYELIGLAPEPLGRGLEIRDVASVRDRVDGQEVLMVTGIIANVAGSRELLPPVRVTLYDTADEELQSVTVPHALDRLDASQTLRFEATIPAPRPEARLLRVGFVAPPS
jgi:predicted Zn finger-like uncharacterized protein